MFIVRKKSLDNNPSLLNTYCSFFKQYVNHFVMCVEFLQVNIQKTE